ncbi:MAG: winged helix-turn-helix domain-containing protein [Thiocapsa sp.]|uniref:winged helix-turn-helix domain-containing tetratricopeptide repeat protein n=1 Tax=Thiocapsa sp. TaxID=2024551 RepID=UPI001BCC678D|nr:winged helix-turn-helix domain-containing protein [Thiocapsa sp.]QVL48672.1 MAG: winged helix-turn-helix domain-containing protein [Thiocapsa sp.]
MIRPEIPAAESSSTSFQVGDWLVDPAAGLIAKGGRAVKLEPKVMEVLSYLALRQGELVTREDLERDVWKGAVVGYDSITAAVIKLRKALTDDARQPRYIATIPKRGYRLIAAVRERVAEVGAESTARARGSASGPTASSASLSRWLLGALVLMLLIGLVVLSYQDKHAQDGNASTSSTPPSIVVLPFTNLTGDPDQASFVDGMTDDMITDLSRLSGLQVIAANTSFTYKDKQVQPQELKAELRVDFVLDGSVRRRGDVMRINARLVDAGTGFQKWAASFDRPTSQVFEVQDEVTDRIVEALALRISDQEKERLAQRSTDNLKAYDAFLEGQALSKLGTIESNRQAQRAYMRAIELDPGYGRAYGALAFTMAVAFRRGWTDTPLETMARALDLAKRGVALDDSIPQTHWALGYVYLMRKELEQAESAAMRSIAVAPNYADGYGLLALINNNLGRPEKAIEQINKGVQLNPYYTWDYPYNLGRAYYTLGRYEEAIAALEKALERNENAAPIKLFLIASYMRAGREGDAEWQAEELQMVNPEETISHTDKAIPIADPELKQAFLDDLRAAGLPD